MRFTRSAAAAAIAVLPAAYAQTSTSCNPTEKTCPDDTGLDTTYYSVDFTTGSSSLASWSAASATNITFGDKGAEFTISETGEAPTISSDFYFLFGRLSVTMQAAPGTGIVSSVVLESDDLDEIDWEWLGGDTTQVETNFFGKGNTSTYDRATYATVSTPQSTMHTYTVDWTSERIEWIVDGTTVRTLEATDSSTNGGNNYPQTPMQIKLGSWCGGCSGEAEGTIEWAGGETTFDDAPYVMYVEKLELTNYNPADKYKYGDETGDWESIELINSTSTATATGSAKITATPSTATTAPTSSLSVSAVKQTDAAVSTTTVASSESASASESSSSSSGTAGSSASSGASSSNGTTGYSGNSNPTATGSSTDSSSTYTGAATANHVAVRGSLLSVAAAALFIL
ncbi:concanavalin A-like lectin/glucanase [Teratosphaeria nubilosa]|uniref:Crh-like protein n=1 Tax=Teratosphaeria nubilosa TaxID=161662 RepID=A0A6G1LBF5_9PEZI|nr:concanavalin A-like lectin/glucanase [Teratosphaeria nubilosa]